MTQRLQGPADSVAAGPLHLLNAVTDVPSTLAILRSEHDYVRTGHKVRHVGVPDSSTYGGACKMAKVEVPTVPGFATQV